MAKLTTSQLYGWMAYYDAEPFGEMRGELRHGQTMALQANINRDPKRQPYQSKDFMNFMPESPVKKISAEEANAIFGAFFGTCNGNA